MKPVNQLVISAILTLALGASALACAADRNKEVRNAEANLTSQQQEAQTEQSRLEQKQREEAAAAQQNRDMSPNDRVELQTKQTEEQAETSADNAKDVAEADKKVTEAYAEMQKERTAIEADANARLKKADARAWEAKKKSTKIEMNKKAKWNAEWNTFTAKKSEVQNRLGSLQTTTNTEWKDAKVKLAKSLDDLDAVVQRLYGDM